MFVKLQNELTESKIWNWMNFQMSTYETEEINNIFKK